MASGETTPVQILFDPAQGQSAQLTTGIVHQFLDGIDRRMTGRAPLIEAKDAPIERSSAAGKLRGVDYLIPGILAMTVMQLGMFTAIPIVNMREKGILKRFRATPLPRSTLVLSQIAVRLIIAVVQTGILLGIASALFHFRIVGSWIEVLGVTVLGAMTFICIGAVIAGIAKTQESAAPLIQMFNLPMMFLSGMFFPTEILPSFLKPVTNAIPATYLADGMRDVALKSTSGHSLGMCAGVMAGWLVCCLAVAMRTFRWD
jgi:ABC-2 type transport system permease protein